VHVSVDTAEDIPLGLHTDESYELSVNSDRIQITSGNAYGTTRAFETLSQLIIDGQEKSVPACAVADAPRFPWRGLLIDTSRHFMPLHVLRRHIDAMSFAKMNTLHWRVTDDESFPFVSQVFPALSQEGAYHPMATHEQDDIVELIEYVRKRGVRIVPEFDSPVRLRCCY